MTSSVLSNQVVVLADQLVADLNELEVVSRLREVERQIKVNQHVDDLIEEIKLKQKELVQAKFYNKDEHIKQLEDELNSLNLQLNELPIVVEYRALQREASSLLEVIQEQIMTVISEKLNVYLEPVRKRQGCSSGGKCGCRSKKGGSGGCGSGGC